MKTSRNDVTGKKSEIKFYILSLELCQNKEYITMEEGDHENQMQTIFKK